MKRLVVIGDLHGLSIWDDIVEVEGKECKYVFVGDYFDSFDIGYAEQMRNFRNILEFKDEMGDDCILLVGNHDYHYMGGIDEQYSGYQFKYNLFIQGILKEALVSGKLQMCYEDSRGYLISHAGITNTWLRGVGYEGGNVCDYVNELFEYTPREFRFKMGENDSYSGNDVTQGLLWVRPPSLEKDMVDGYIQVVGHTVEESIERYGDGRIFVIDTLWKGSNEEYLVIDDEGIHIERLRKNRY
jgi:hypothetical protein